MKKVRMCSLLVLSFAVVFSSNSIDAHMSFSRSPQQKMWQGAKQIGQGVVDGVYNGLAWAGDYSQLNNAWQNYRKEMTIALAAGTALVIYTAYKFGKRRGKKRA